jgi:hypothetical protein
MAERRSRAWLIIYLRSLRHSALSTFLRVLQERLGIPFTKSREILEFYNPDMSPAAGSEIINERGEAILASRNARKDR